ncbi:MAG: carboxypeptidase-like regulatory domain-containing protein [Balneolaceae bacterium]|nr:carboxypeptidase-like regulatory domain-containing protein [Balneolaceae bacterium]
MRNRPCIAGLALGMLLVCSPAMVAQVGPPDRYSFDFKGKPLDEALEEVAGETAIDLIYDPILVRDIVIYKRIRNRTVPEILTEMLSGTSLDFLTLSSGTHVIVRAVKDAPSFGSYFGKVVDEQTGEPLQGASVILADASGGTSTNASGSFSINRLISGNYTMIFSYVGYEPVQKTIRIEPNKNLREKIELKPKPVEFTPVIVSGHLPNISYAHNNGQSVNPETTWETNGRMQDAIRSLSLFSGIQFGLPLADLHLQGGQKGEHRILLDGVPIYNPHSFGQLYSAFSPFAIGRVRLHKAGYKVSEGSKISGMVDLSHDIEGVRTSGLTAHMDPLSFNMRGDYRSVGSEQSSFKLLGAARFNYWDFYREPTLNRTIREWESLDPLVTSLLLDSGTDPSDYLSKRHDSDVRFHDLHLASAYKIDRDRTLKASLYVGENFINTNRLSQSPTGSTLPQYLYALDQYRWNNLMGQITFEQRISPRLDLSSQVSHSRNRFQQDYTIGTADNLAGIPGSGSQIDAVLAQFESAEAQNLVPSQNSDNLINHTILRTDGSYSFTPRFSLESGIQFDFVRSQIDLGDLFYLPTISDEKSILAGSYLEGNWQPGNYLNLAVGSRITFHSNSGKVYPEPRVSLQWDHPRSDRRYWSVRLAGGLYRQFINQFEITNPGPTSLVPSFSVWSHAGASSIPKAWHASGSLIMKPALHTTLNLEGYFKWQPTAYIVSYRNLLDGISLNRSRFEAFGESTNMRSYGAGIRIHQDIPEQNIKLMAGYDYNRAVIAYSSQFGRSIPPPWNEPHRVQFRVLWNPLPVFSSVLKWQSIYGRAWAFRQAYYDYLFVTGSDSFSTPEQDRLSPFHQLDLSLIYRPKFAFADFEMRLDLINLLDRRNTIDWMVEQADTAGEQVPIRKRTMPGFNPSISIQVRL